MYIKRDRDVLSTVEYDIPITKNIYIHTPPHILLYFNYIIINNQSFWQLPEK